MINGKSVLGIIPARGGSKGVIGKNIRVVAGKPLIAWTIEAAKKSLYLDRVVLSSEDALIIETAKEFGCEVPFVRPLELAQDDTPGMDVVIHAINTLAEKYDYVVLLQPTSPLRLTEDMDGCLENCNLNSANVSVSVTEPEMSPFWMYSIDAQGRLKPIIEQSETFARRQDLPKTYGLNGAVYVAKTDWLLENHSFLTNETLAYLMPPERSIDVDTEIDLLVVEHFLKL